MQIGQGLDTVERCELIVRHVQRAQSNERRKVRSDEAVEHVAREAERTQRGAEVGQVQEGRGGGGRG